MIVCDGGVSQRVPKTGIWQWDIELEGRSDDWGVGETSAGTIGKWSSVLFGASADPSITYSILRLLRSLMWGCPFLKVTKQVLRLDEEAILEIPELWSLQESCHHWTSHKSYSWQGAWAIGVGWRATSYYTDHSYKFERSLSLVQAHGKMVTQSKRCFSLLTQLVDQVIKLFSFYFTSHPTSVSNIPLGLEGRLCCNADDTCTIVSDLYLWNL